MNTERDLEANFKNINSFSFEGKDQGITFIETIKVNGKVDCDVYSFDGDDTKDLGIIKIKLGGKTPLQKVLKGDRTVEGYISGKGRLIVTDVDGRERVYEVNDEMEDPLAVAVEIGQTMQWRADDESELRAYEICFPPYKDGRYENINEGEK